MGRPVSALDHRHNDQRAGMDLASDPASLSAARDFVGWMLDVWGCDDPDRVVALLTDELVSNAVRHASGTIRLEMSVVDGQDVRVQASDECPDSPVEPRETHDGEGGLGLRIVESLARRWGVERYDTFKTVWFEAPIVHRHPASH
jgi:anti-sigma regulatory factor (Ser/Thr protein kinase)